MIGILCKTAGGGNISTLKRHKLGILSIFRVKIQSQTTEPCIAAKHPFRVDVKSGQRYSWCACGYSKKQPFCDGSHKALAPKISPFRFIAEQDGPLLLCGCKHTSDAPYCDGTHKQDFVQKAPLPPASQP